MELEIGKWYKKANENYGKFLGLESDKWLCKEHISIRTKKYYNTGNYYSFGYMDDAILVTDLTEIQQYLPKGHPDKISTPRKILQDDNMNLLKLLQLHEIK